MTTHPNNLLYTTQHEWVKTVQDGRVRIGITQFAVDQLGDVVTVELPSVGDSIENDAVFGSVESVKAVSDLFSPLTGVVAATNESNLEETPELVNDDPYNTGWMIEVDFSDKAELTKLMTQEEYSAFIKEQA